MRWIWPALLGLFRPLYLAYAWWCRLFPLALIIGLWWLSQLDGAIWGVSPFQLACLLIGVIAAWSIWRGWQNGESAHPNPWQSAFMAWFGTLKWFHNQSAAPAVNPHWPSSFLVENPGGYRIGGKDTRSILNTLQPGDILLRGYEGYVDGAFIRKSSRSAGTSFRAGWFTHAAIYVGTLSPADRDQVDAAYRDRPSYFETGPQMVIHAMAKGVHCEDILTFLRCDYLCVLRLPDRLTRTAGLDASSVPWRPRAEASSTGDQLQAALWQALQNDEALERSTAVEALRQSALEKIGQAYDFDCSDTQAFNRFSCAELVYYGLRGVLGAVGLQPQVHALYPLAPAWPAWRLLERITITPDDIHDLARNGGLRCVWIDPQSADRTQTSAISS